MTASRVFSLYIIAVMLSLFVGWLYVNAGKDQRMSLSLSPAHPAALHERHERAPPGLGALAVVRGDDALRGHPLRPRRRAAGCGRSHLHAERDGAGRLRRLPAAGRRLVRLGPR